MIRSSLKLLAAAWLLAGASAQQVYNIDPDSVPDRIRDVWCQTQVESCPLICQQSKPGTTLVNTCDADTLQYGCLCGDNMKPNMSEYSMTIPFFVCQEWGNQCVNGCAGGDNGCAADCRQNHPCGAQDPERVNVTSTAASTASKTEDPNTIYTGPGGVSSDDDDDNNNNNGAGALLAVGRTYGMAVVFGSLFLGFVML